MYTYMCGEHTRWHVWWRRNENGWSYRNFHRKKNRANELYDGKNLCTRKRGRTERGEVFPKIPARMQVKCTFIAPCEKFAIYLS